MNRKKDFWWRCLGFLLAAALLAPGGGDAKDKRSCVYCIDLERLLTELNLAPEKAKEFQAVGVKYDQTRLEISDSLKKNEGELIKLLATAQPDEGKIKELVAAVSSDHDKLLETFKAQRLEEMAFLTPVQQGKFLLALKRWHKEMRNKFVHRVKIE